MTKTVDIIVENYKIFLEKSFPEQFKLFLSRQKNSPDSAKFEAVMFSIMQNLGQNPTVNESTSDGGMDFSCGQNPDKKFYLEATHIDKEKTTHHSGLPDNSEYVGSFSNITEFLRRKISGKTMQMSGQKLPRILAVGSFHTWSSTLLGEFSAETLLTSEQKITVKINTNESFLSTDLGDSIFFRKFKNNSIEPARQSISAILFAACYKYSCHLVGILHPEPAEKLDPAFLPEIPFVRVKEWPLVTSKLDIEWIQGCKIVTNVEPKVVSY